jgi:hypothetical protein
MFTSINWQLRITILLHVPIFTRFGTLCQGEIIILSVRLLMTNFDILTHIYIERIRRLLGRMNSSEGRLILSDRVVLDRSWSLDHIMGRRLVLGFCLLVWFRVQIARMGLLELWTRHCVVVIIVVVVPHLL